VIAMLNTDIPAATTPPTLPPTSRISGCTRPDSTRTAEYESGRHDGQHLSSRGVMRYVGTWGGAYVPALTMAPSCAKTGRAAPATTSPSSITPTPASVSWRLLSARPHPSTTVAAARCPVLRRQRSAFCKDTSFVTTHQHSPGDQVQFITPTYAASIAQVMAAVAGAWRGRPHRHGF